MISFDGELVGPNASGIMEDIQSKFELRKPVPFSSDVTAISGITEVIIENLAIHFLSGVNLGIRYSMVLKESASASTSTKRGAGSGGTEPPSQEEDSKREIERKTKEIIEESKAGEKPAETEEERPKK